MYIEDIVRDGEDFEGVQEVFPIKVASCQPNRPATVTPTARPAPGFGRRRKSERPRKPKMRN